ncbi:MFS transporter [Myroides ceti]|uniref:MFS transporter n=1 Tax=Paenimyroides ceti TaxID=395087 RepID=A0ABT8D186_9FLAO|nr:MFS transporter [Paenimyroides ceti]MDN3710219.1 MFS transporter [Paenimyroides ceti]
MKAYNYFPCSLSKFRSKQVPCRSFWLVMKNFGIIIWTLTESITCTWILALVYVCQPKRIYGFTFFGRVYDRQFRFFLKKCRHCTELFWCGSILGSFVGGWLTDKFGSFKIQTMSLFCSIPFYLILPFFKSFESLCIAILFLSCQRNFSPANSASVSYYAKPENLTRAFSLNRMALNLGYSIGPAIGGFLAAVSYDFLFYTNA